ncbi:MULTISPECIES: hypothetical protein [Streptomyces]|uniref:Uncharacterized protein n=1 Tax=Streptomyces viridochromogenes TaxID=1938 RepID=A0A0L8LDL7_STRVR|nr:MULTISPECIES: hypothetical protein [Streptomyces]KOG36121.1 hypothetical protein ADK34_02800 [Streptomyces viridochromogenes]
MRVDEPMKPTLTRVLIPVAIIIAAPILLVAGAPIRRRYLRHVYGEAAPAVVDKANGRVSIHYFVLSSRLLDWLCAPTEALSRLGRGGR